MIHFLLASLFGLCIGLHGAVQPGPLMAFIISESINNGRKAGIKVACVPVLTDPIILLIGIMAVVALPSWIEGIISLLGGAALFYFGFQGLQTARRSDSNLPIQPLGAKSEKDSRRARKWRFKISLDLFFSETFHKAILVNYLNPYLYVYAFTINAPNVTAQLNKGHLFSALGYVFFFFFGIVAVNSLIALLAGSFKGRASNLLIKRINSFLSLCMFLMGTLTACHGISLFF